MIILGIESTCDETACAIVKDGRQILSTIVASQIDLHEQFGGVVPELACRRHIDAMIPVIDQALTQANLTLPQIDLIAVANGPGLIGALLLGINAAKSLSLALNKPLIGINHIEAHLYAALMSHEKEIAFPAIGAVLSGGHTSLVLMRDIGDYTLIGQTVDDAVGEAFDKVAKLMELPYPGGPQIEQLALLGDSSAYTFKPGKVKANPFDFSFSGLKTAVLYALRGQNGKSQISLTQQQKQNVAAAFQEAAFQDIVAKTLAAAEQHNCQTILFGGGVTNNRRLRRCFDEASFAHTYLWPSAGLSLDNAAMIAGLAYHKSKKGFHDLHLEASTSVTF